MSQTKGKLGPTEMFYPTPPSSLDIATASNPNQFGLTDRDLSLTEMKEICPRGNNKVLYISLYHDKCLLFMLELY